MCASASLTVSLLTFSLSLGLLEMSYQQLQGAASNSSGGSGAGGRHPSAQQWHAQQSTSSTSSPLPPPLRSDGRTAAIGSAAGTASLAASSPRISTAPRHVETWASGAGFRHSGSANGGAAYDQLGSAHLVGRHYHHNAQQSRHQKLQLPLSSSLARSAAVSGPSTTSFSSPSSAQYASPPSTAGASLPTNPSIATAVVSGAMAVGSSYTHWRGASEVGGLSDRRRRSGSGRSGGGGGSTRTSSPGPRHHTPQAQHLQQRLRADASAAHFPEHPAASSVPETAAGLVASPPSNLPDNGSTSSAQSWSQPPPPPSAAPAGSVPLASSGAPPVSSHVGQPSRRGGNGGAYSPRSSAAATSTTMAGSGGVSAAASGSASSMPPPPASGAASAATARAASPSQKVQGATSGGFTLVSAISVRLMRPNGEERPTVALSQNIMSVYEAINARFYQERQLLLTAPAKYAARRYEDAAGHYVPYPGEEIAERYVVKEVIGKGSFGTVLHCIDQKYNEAVAVKVIRSGPYFESQGWFEAQVVAHLNNDPALQNLVVQLRKVFLWKGHMVLVFEPLSFSLYRLITLTKYNGVSLDLTRKFAYQMIKVLLVLEQHQPPIIHCDLKPENVLLRDPSRSEVRVIDFGSACYQQQPKWSPPPPQVVLPPTSPSSSPGLPWDSAAEGASGGVKSTPTVDDGSVPLSPLKGQQQRPHVTTGLNTASVDTALRSGDTAATAEEAASVGNTGDAAPAAAAAAGAGTGDGKGGDIIMPKYIQSRYYRSPEVILELGYTTAIDRWSLGCFLVEMHTGVPLFPGKNEGDMVAYFTSILGPLPDYMIAASPKRTQLYYTCPSDPSLNRNGDELAHGGASAGAAPAEDGPPELTPMSSAPGHAMGSPFFLRAPRVEGEGAAAAAVAGSSSDDPPLSLEEILGVHKGGPRGCRAGQPGHDEAAYKVFCDFIRKLLQYDPRKRVSCQQAIQHPFLEPIRALKSRSVAPPSTAPNAEDGKTEAGSAPPPPLPGPPQ
ncbi:protein kinase, putative [Leishmania tarentolae]|uniref:Protein kinase, putative n=1 Tax=Leishmania tarentolae TaxID=5689 RepID=A0A640KCH1_LEITA|nr:protein kinase, putative [Leishmania tarentolae]